MPCTLISVGSNCHVAHWLKQTGLQTQSYPFDWLLSPSYLGLRYCADMIETRFDHFLDDLRLDHRQHVVSARNPKTQLFHHRELLDADPVRQGLERERLQRRAERLLQVLDAGAATLVYCFDMRPASLTPAAWAEHEAQARRLVELLPHCELHIYYLHDDHFPQDLLRPGPSHPRISTSTYVRDTSVSKTWGRCPKLFEQWAAQRGLAATPA